jgi:carboxypeptidase-like protein
MQRIALLIFFIGIVFPGMAQKIITGKVLDESNSFPLQCATVTAKGMTGIKQTDKNGIFRMDVPDTTKTLVISCIGFVEKEVSITRAGWMDIQLKKPCFFNETFMLQGQNPAYIKSQMPALMTEF